MPEPMTWTEAPKSKDHQVKEDVQGIISPLQVGAESDSTLQTDTLGAENVMSATGFSVEHTNSE